jgi:small subunit ribosomal protein S4
MARYIGPKIKLSRRFGIKLGLRTNEEAVTKRPYKPGPHGPRGRRGRPKEYELQLAEKQKARFIYGVLEKQFRRYYEKALKSENVGLALLQTLETRLDTVVYRAGFALTQQQARQFVTHGHVQVNGQRLSIPSYAVQVGDSITLDKNILMKIEESRGTAVDLPVWLRKEARSVQMLEVPARDQITALVDEQQIVSFYSR